MHTCPDGPERRAGERARPGPVDDALDEPFANANRSVRRRRTAIAPADGARSANDPIAPAGKTVSAARTRYGGSSPARLTASAEPCASGWWT